MSTTGLVKRSTSRELAAPVHEDGGLMQRPEGYGGGPTISGNELAVVKGAAQEEWEIKSAITIARSFPRDEYGAEMKIRNTCKRPGFAERARYRFKRGKKLNLETGRWEDNYVEGPGIVLAREAATKWGNIRYGLQVVREDEHTRLLKGWAWDLETNTKGESEDLIEKVIERKKANEYDDVIGQRANAGGEIIFLIRPNERDLRELQNRRGAFLVRNAILQILPADVVDACMDEVRSTIVNNANRNLPAEIEKILRAFSAYGVSKKQLEEHVGKSSENWTGEIVADLTGIGMAIKDGTPKEEFFGESDEPKSGARPGKATAKASVPTNAKVSKAENRGHGEDNLSSITQREEVEVTETEQAPAPRKSNMGLSLDTRKQRIELGFSKLRVPIPKLEEAVENIRSEWTEENVEYLEGILESIDSKKTYPTDHFDL